MEDMERVELDRSITSFHVRKIPLRLRPDVNAYLVRLRPGVSAYLQLPVDLTIGEGKRLIAMLESLPLGAEEEVT